MKYSEMYLRLFNAVTDALEALDTGEPAKAKSLLVAAQQATEEMYMETEDGEA